MYKDNNLSNKAHILIVDNDPVMRLLMKESLLCGDYHIDEVESGRDAITYINKHVPDVVLLDVRMPEMSGFDVCSEIRKKHDENNISIIMVTGLDDSESIEKAFQLGATDFITKPINWDIFPYRIQYAVKARTAFNELIKRQTHLDRMETISQIISPGDNRNHILKNALSALIEIFNADRSFIINITDKKPGLTSILHEALKDNIKSLYGCEELLSNEKLVHINSRLSTTDIIVRNYQDDNSLNIVREMSIPLHKNNKHTYFLSLHQCSALPDWSSSDRETFKSIAERLAAVLSQNLLIENLHQSQNLLRQAEHISHLGNWSWDILSGAIKWSDEVYKIYSQLPDKFTPTFAYINSVTHKHDIAILNNFKKSIFKSGKAHSVEFRIITPDNDIRYIYQQGIGVINSDGDVYVVNGTIRDITENKKTTIALFESEARFRRLAENAPDAIFRISLPDEQFEYISPAAFSLFGYKPDEFQDVTWLLKNVITSNNRKYFKSQWIETKQGRNTTSFEYSIQKKTKDTRWLNQHNVPIIDDITNELIAIEGIIYDVTTKRRMHEKLLESESDMRGILTNLQDTFFRINTSGRIIMASESVNDLLHLSPFELLGKKFGDLFVNNDEYDNFIRELANNNGILISYHVQLKCKNGDSRWISLSMQSSEKSTGFIEGTARDITNQLLQQQQEVHDKKMEAIGQLTSGIAHDFGNLMTIAKGNLALLDEIYTESNNHDASEFELLSDARSAIKDGISLTKQLLAFSRGKAIKPVAINVAETITNFSNIFKYALGDRINFSTSLPADLPDILIDPAQFESALLNIVINARDAMQDGGDLSITLSTEKLFPNNICHVIIKIKDNGCGMSNDILQHVTEPFYTTKKNEGTGLGLSMVYGFVQQSNGHLNIISSSGNGTSIELKFPAYYGQKENINHESLQPLTSFNNETVLIVEDRTAVRRFAVRCLDKLNLNILEASNAEEAKTILLSNSNINLLFTDILMPGEINGRELANWASEKFPSMKILLTTATENDPYNTVNTDHNDFLLLSKPYNSHELKNILRSLF